MIKKYKPILVTRNTSQKFNSFFARLKKLAPVFIGSQKALEELQREIYDEAESKFSDALNTLRGEISGLRSHLSGSVFGGDVPAEGFGYYESVIEKDFYKSKKSWLYKAIVSHFESLGIDTTDEKFDDVIESHQRVVGGFLGLFGAFTAGADFTVAQVAAMQHASESRYKLDPHAKAIIDNLSSYVVGRGVTFKSPVPQIQEFLEKVYWKNNNMDSWHKERFILLLRKGEHFNRYRKVADGLSILTIPTDQIVDFERREDMFTLSYKRMFIAADTDSISKSRTDFATIWYPDAFLREKIEFRGLKESDRFSVTNEGDFRAMVSSTHKEKLETSEMIYHMKFGPETETRGVPIMVTVLRYLQYYDDFVKDVGRLHHEQARVIMIKWVNNRDVVEKPFPSVRGGVMLEAIKGTLEYEFKSPDIKSGQVEAVGRMFRLSISAGVRIPEMILWQDANTATYASVKEMESPFSNNVLDLQDTYKDFMNNEVDIFKRFGIQNGLLEPEYTMLKFGDGEISEATVFMSDILLKMEGNAKGVDVKMVVDKLEDILGSPEEIAVPTMEIETAWGFPEIVHSDPFKTAQSLKIYWEMGIISEETAAMKAGLNWKVELSRKLQARKRMLELEQREEMKRLEFEAEANSLIMQGRGLGLHGAKEDGIFDSD